MSEKLTTQDTKPVVIDDEQPWAQRSDENERWYNRFSSYLAMGPTRSVRGVYAKEKGYDHSVSVPASWTDARKRFDWLKRAEAYDAWRRREVFTQGNAAEAKRVKKLDTLIDLLYARAVAMLESIGPEVEFNDKIVALLLSTLEAMAKATGATVSAKRETLPGKSGSVAVEIDSDEQTMRVVFYTPEVETLDFDATKVEELPEPQGDLSS